MCTLTLNNVHALTVLVDPNQPIAFDLTKIFAVDNTNTNAFDRVGNSYVSSGQPFACSNTFDSSVPSTKRVLYGCSNNYVAIEFGDAPSGFCCNKYTVANCVSGEKYMTVDPA